MNRKNLTAAVLAGLAGAAGIVGSAQAVNINPDGIGQVLLYPYYTTNGGNLTVLSVVNTSKEAKAVKVRFMEGQNTREVLDFNLYMSPFDVWAAAIIDNDGTPTLVVDDLTCTVPYLYENEDADGVRDGMQEFLTYGLNDGGSEDISRATEGHFEMIEMGTLVGGSAASADHGTNGTPANCASLVTAWTVGDTLDPTKDGYWLQNEFTDLEAPSGGLFGGAAIVNVDGGTMYSYDAKAINGFATQVDANDVLHTKPGKTTPNLNSGDVMDASVFMPDGSVQNSASLSRGVDAVSYAFMHDQIMNEYVTGGIANGATEWVITFPTKHFYVWPDSSESPDPVAPFTSTWDGSGACETVVLATLWDTEERVAPDEDGIDIPPVVSPAPPDPPVKGVFPFSLCFETSVIRFDGSAPPEDPDTPRPIPDTTEILGSTNFHTIANGDLGFGSGWARLQLATYPLTNDAGEIIAGTGDRILDNLAGLPVTGFAVNRFSNGTLTDDDGVDVLAKYGGIFQHKGTRMLSQNLD